MAYESASIAEVLPRLNTSYFLPAFQREFVWSSDQVASLFDSLMREYPISSFLLWQAPENARDDVEAYELLYAVRSSDNRAQQAGSRVYSIKNLTFVLDGQQRLTALLVGLQGTYSERRTSSGKGARTQVAKKMYLDLLHDGDTPDADGEVYYRFEFFDCVPLLLNRDSYWFEAGRILAIDSREKLDQLVDRQIKAIRDVRPLTTPQASVVEKNLRCFHRAIFEDEPISYHTETDSDHERILEIFVRANSGGSKLTKSDLLLSTLTMHWGAGNAREEINGFVEKLNTGLTRRNRLNKDFVMKACLVLLDLPVAYGVSSFNKATCAHIRDRWDDIRDAITRAVDCANAFGIDENNLTSANALIPVAYYLSQHSKITLRGESTAEVQSASAVRKWLIAALLNRVFGGSSDSLLAKLREVLQIHRKPTGEFPFGDLDEAIRGAHRLPAATQETVESVLSLEYSDNECFLGLSLLYDERNWGTIDYQIDHIFPQDLFRRGPGQQFRDFRDNYCNLALVIGAENAGKGSRPLDEWLATRAPEYIQRHCIPNDRTLWRIENYERFIIERRKLLVKRLGRFFGPTT
jgi:hypothetical protein